MLASPVPLRSTRVPPVRSTKRGVVSLTPPLSEMSSAIVVGVGAGAGAGAGVVGLLVILLLKRPISVLRFVPKFRRPDVKCYLLDPWHNLMITTVPLLVKAVFENGYRVNILFDRSPTSKSSVRTLCTVLVLLTEAAKIS